MLTMLPGCLAARQCRAALCIMLNVPVRLVSMTARQPLSVKSIAACGNCPPALLTSRSSASAAGKISRQQSRSTAARSRISSGNASQGSPRAASAARTRVELLDAAPADQMTRAPSRAASHAVARPIPLPRTAHKNGTPLQEPGGER